MNAEGIIIKVTQSMLLHDYAQKYDGYAPAQSLFIV